MRLLRKSQPFWSILGKYGIFSCVLRVPITLPPEKLRGVLLSAMCVPDLRGTQGMFSYYTTRKRDEGEKIGGEVHHVTRDGDDDPRRAGRPARTRSVADRGELRLPFTVDDQGRRTARSSRSASERYELRKDVYTDWVRVGFRAAPGVTVRGVCKFLLLGTEPEFGLYVTPINIDPEQPGDAGRLPVGLFDLPGQEAGHFATLGLAEDTWALNEGVLNDDHFIQQCLDMDDEREAMFLDALDKVPRGPASPASSTAPTACSTRSGATSTRRTRPGPTRRRSPAAT